MTWQKYTKGRDAIAIKYDANGNVVWKRSFGGAKDERFYSVAATPDGGFVAVGYSNSIDGDMSDFDFRGVYDAIIIKYDQDGIVQWKNLSAVRIQTCSIPSSSLKTEILLQAVKPNLTIMICPTYPTMVQRMPFS